MESKLVLKDSPTLADLQHYMEDLVKERGFDNSLSGLFHLFMEECGELAKAARKQANLRSDVTSTTTHNAGHEAADVLMFLLSICNQLGIDLEKSFREKEEINKQRQWK